MPTGKEESLTIAVTTSILTFVALNLLQLDYLVSFDQGKRILCRDRRGLHSGSIQLDRTERRGSAGVCSSVGFDHGSIR
jgi:hypothetical protein